MSAGILSVDELIRLLRGLKACQLQPRQIESMLSGAVLDHSSLAPYLFRRQGCYTRNLVYRNDDFELLALVWDEGARSAIHDHSGQECFFSVQQGYFQAQDFEALEGGLAPGQAVLRQREQLTTLTPGKVDHRSGHNTWHRIVNAGSERGITLHIYAHPIDECLIFDASRSWCTRREMRYDSVQGKAKCEGLYHLSPRCTGVPLSAH